MSTLSPRRVRFGQVLSPAYPRSICRRANTSRSAWQNGFGFECAYTVRTFVCGFLLADTDRRYPATPSPSP